ncbi:unnamed protein product [Allacma fusca]|uniref:Uncharacterized protein n=1 Tax=Allacma fusca TaxID=39272 RepID=A0A8J2JKQ2_9HEXA|nr:unnamed protein product [Allacma fusca]
MSPLLQKLLPRKYQPSDSVEEDQRIWKIVGSFFRFRQVAGDQEDSRLDSSREIPGPEPAKRLGLSLLSLHFYAVLKKRVHHTS